MIQANELRIGNIVQTGAGTGHLLETTSIRKGGINCNSLSYGHKTALFRWDEIHPVALTSEILQAAGFERNPGKQSYYSGFGFDYDIRINRVLFHKNQNKVYIDNITALHQLQNLYFALTGTELTINLENVKV